MPGSALAGPPAVDDLPAQPGEEGPVEVDHLVGERPVRKTTVRSNWAGALVGVDGPGHHASGRDAEVADDVGRRLAGARRWTAWPWSPA